MSYVLLSLDADAAWHAYGSDLAREPDVLIVNPATRACRRYRTKTQPQGVVSRLGGDPDLSAGIAWPLHQGKPLHLVAQIVLGQDPSARPRCACWPPSPTRAS